MDGVKEVVTRGNKKLEALDLYSNKVLEMCIRDRWRNLWLDRTRYI